MRLIEIMTYSGIGNHFSFPIDEGGSKVENNIYKDIELINLLIISTNHQESRSICDIYSTLTHNEYHLHANIHWNGFAFTCRCLGRIFKCRVVWDHNSHIKGDNQNQPIPTRFSYTIMRQNKSLFLYCCGLILWYCHTLLLYSI